MIDLNSISALLQIALSLLISAIGTPYQLQAVKLTTETIQIAQNAIIDAQRTQIKINAPIGGTTSVIPSQSLQPLLDLNQTTIMETQPTTSVTPGLVQPTKIIKNPRWTVLPFLEKNVIKWEIEDADAVGFTCFDENNQQIYRNNRQKEEINLNQNNLLSIFEKGKNYVCEFQLQNINDKNEVEFPPVRKVNLNFKIE